MDEWHFIAERKIREAMEEGAFEDLQGSGKPLDLREDPYEDPALRMAHRLMRNNGVTPAWIAEAREIESEARRLAQGRCADYDSRVAALNRRIRVFNLKAPALSLHKRLFEER